MQPVVVYIDECESFFTGGKKNKDKDGPSRFKKDFNTYKNQALGPEHRVIVIGTTKTPENGDLKDFKAFFDKFLYMPYPDYASRHMVWKHYMEEMIRQGLRKGEEMLAQAVTTAKPPPPMTGDEIKLKTREILNSVDLSSLAYISEGYSAGAIARTIRSVVTTRRVALSKKRHITNVDFLDNLSLQEVTFHDDKLAFLAFTRAITGIDDRRKKIEAMVAGEDNEKKGDKKKK
jgi:SpoVK/Ycf46/Vps4 family AAA+-type ATPase